MLTIEKIEPVERASVWNQHFPKAREIADENKDGSGEWQQYYAEQTSMVAELLSIIHVEEYVTDIACFPGIDYLNKLEMASIKKMVSGKLWLDTRKFVSRQNNIIVNGLYALFGMTLGKSATNIRAEACDFLLDANHIELRKILCNSVNNSGRTYSNWIRRLSSDDYPCDEFGLFLLSFMFKHHVIVILANKTWCTFKTGRMSTFEQICKADHVLVWMGRIITLK